MERGSFVTAPAAATMPVKGGTKCIKYLLFGFNFIFWVRRPGPWPRAARRGARGTGMEGRGRDAPGAAFCLLFWCVAFAVFSTCCPLEGEGRVPRCSRLYFSSFFGFYLKAG